MASAGKSAQKPSTKTKPPAIQAAQKKIKQFITSATRRLKEAIPGSLAEKFARKKSPKPINEDQDQKKGPLKPSTTNSLLIEQLPITGSAAGAFIAFCLLFFYLPIYGSNQNQTKQHIEQIGQQAAKQLHHTLNQAQITVDAIAKQPQVIGRLNNNKGLGLGMKVKNLETLLTSGTPYGTNLYIYSDNPERQGSTDAGFAALDIVRRTLDGSPPRVEAAHSSNQWQILASSPVSLDGKIIGVTLLAFSLPFITEPLELADPSIGQLKVFQSHDITGDPIFSSGQTTAASGYSWRTTLPGTAWTIAFNPSDSFLDDLSRPVWPLILVMLAGLGAIAGAAFYATTFIRQKADEDFSFAQTLLKNLSTGVQGEDGDFHFRSAQNATNDIIDFFNGQLPEEIPQNSQEASANQPELPPLPNMGMKFNAKMLEKIQSEEAEKIPASIFRANDIRGIVEKTLTESAVILIGQAIASEALVRNEQTIIVANDGRLSSPMLKGALIQGLTASGCNVISIGTVPTPVLYYATHILKAHSGVMITGSHSAPDYNGLKIVIGGHRLAGDEITDLYRRVVERDFTSGQGNVSTKEMISLYQKQILDDVVLARPLKVVVDCGNGVAAKIAPRLFEQLGCEVIPLYCTVDGTFPHHNPDNCVEKSLEKLIKDVKEYKADMGFSIDGDGDRVEFVTNAGNIIYPDKLLMLLSRDVLTRNPGANIIFDVKSTRRLSSLINNSGGRPILWKSGHSFIKQKMVETSAVLAGEMSGHIFFKERWFGFDDGIYSAIRIAEVLSHETDASEVVFKTLPSAESTSEILVPASDANKFGLIERLKKEGNFDDASITTIDGIRADFTWGWGLVRASNTTPALTLRFEADDNEGLERIKSLFKKQLLALDPELKIPF